MKQANSIACGRFNIRIISNSPIREGMFITEESTLEAGSVATYSWELIIKNSSDNLS